MQIGAICMIALGILGKFGALFSTIPDPVVGGVFCCMFGMITAVGISNLQYVDLNSVRNLFIIGFAFLMGFAVPDYFKKNTNAIDTGRPSPFNSGTDSVSFAVACSVAALSSSLLAQSSH